MSFRVIWQWLCLGVVLISLAACGGGGKSPDRQGEVPITGGQLNGDETQEDQDEEGQDEEDHEEGDLEDETDEQQPDYVLSGTISGLTGSLTLMQYYDSAAETLLVNTNGPFSFKSNLKQGVSFEVTIDSQPTGQKCLVRNGFGSASIASATQLRVECSSLSSTAQLSGTLISAANITFDSDLNDPASIYSDNDDFDRPQIIPSQIRLHGFASADGTWQYGDHFAYWADYHDVYKVSLQRNQLIQLQVIDFDQFSIETTYSGDLDLLLFDAEGELVAMSDDVTEFEEIVVAKSGEYYVVVEAYSGISKYVLQLHPVGAGGANRTPDILQEFVADEMIVKFSEQSINSFNTLSGANTFMSFSHRNSSRPALAKIDHDAKVAAQSQQRPSLTALQEMNPEAYRKLMTMREIKAVSLQPGVEYAEPNYIVRKYAVPNDEFYGYQWHYPLISLPQAWDITTGSTSGKPVIVAVVDTGVVLNHSEFAGQLVPGYDFIRNSENARDGDGIDANPDDPGDSNERGKSSFHGTHVAGTIAAKSNDKLRVAGVSWGAKIMPLRALGTLGGADYDIQQAMRYAAGLSNDSNTVPQQKADIINLSIGGGAASLSDKNTVDAVRAAGVIIVAAAGNENTDTPSYPASYDGVISVSAVDINSAKAPYSNFGRSIDVAAPGGDASKDRNNDGRGDGVLSAGIDDSSGQRDSVAIFMQGTSMASPHMAGVVALMKAIYPAMTPTQVDTLLANGELTDDIGSSGWDDKFGYGLINAYKAVLAAQRLGQGGETPSEPTVTVVATPIQVVFGQSATATVTLSTQGSGSIQVRDVTATAPWLSVKSEANGSGMGSYQLQVSRDGLNSGLYQANLVFTFTNDKQLLVPTTMQVGNDSYVGEIATQYVILVDAETMATVNSISLPVSHGIADFQFTDIPVGDYMLFSGSDVDNDGFICQSGESCGAYPTVAQPQEIKVLGSNITDLDFVVDIVGGLSSTSSIKNVDHEQHQSGLKRVVPEKVKVPMK